MNGGAVTQLDRIATISVNRCCSEHLASYGFERFSVTAEPIKRAMMASRCGLLHDCGQLIDPGLNRMRKNGPVLRKIGSGFYEVKVLRTEFAN